MPASPSLRRVAPVALLAAVAIPATALAAHPKANGYYYATNAKSQTSVTIGVVKGKISNGQASLRFKKGGKLCAAPGASVAGPVGVSFNIAKHPVAPSSSGTFSVKTKNAAKDLGRAPITVTGTFTSSKRATIRVKSSFKGCTGSFATKKAVYTQGG